MPRLNGTGPQGKGPGTGRKQGSCGSRISVQSAPDVPETDENVDGRKTKHGRQNGQGCGSGLGRRPKSAA
ncbi:MAG: DUF5320 domain-containing protein [Candidatus Moranbacteria bacterium]|nr:DUF5320 domain-containing protein [Candidatus Moranbacteria bacterium]NTW75779.1 DUF5320 domain-containing protein [Candidatus Moranbacteria bacterium]